LAAQYDLGVVYLKGMGVPKDNKQATDWFNKAADKGFPSAMTALGLMAEGGDGAAKNSVEAYKWLMLASIQGDPTAKNVIQTVAKELSPEQVEHAKKEAQFWVKAHQN